MNFYSLITLYWKINELNLVISDTYIETDEEICNTEIGKNELYFLWRMQQCNEMTHVQQIRFYQIFDSMYN